MLLSVSQMTFIRPFIYVRESEIIAQGKQIGIPIIKSGCPMDGATKRQDMKELLAEIYERFPQSKDNFLKMLHNPDQLSLWDPKKR
jgi:tRNA(Ile)-lysidine synthase TilS/MesJ